MGEFGCPQHCTCAAVLNLRVKLVGLHHSCAWWDSRLHDTCNHVSDGAVLLLLVLLTIPGQPCLQGFIWLVTEWAVVPSSSMSHDLACAAWPFGHKWLLLSSLLLLGAHKCLCDVCQCGCDRIEVRLVLCPACGHVTCHLGLVLSQLCDCLLCVFAIFIHLESPLLHLFPLDTGCKIVHCAC